MGNLPATISVWDFLAANMIFVDETWGLKQQNATGGLANQLAWKVWQFQGWITQQHNWYNCQLSAT